jgi:hypothetical protein
MWVAMLTRRAFFNRRECSHVDCWAFETLEDAAAHYASHGEPDTQTSMILREPNPWNACRVEFFAVEFI